MMQHLGYATWQYYGLMVFVVFMLTIYGGIIPLVWLAKKLGHTPVMPVWKDSLWGPILGAWCLLLHASLFTVMAVYRRRLPLTVYERGFAIGKSIFAYDDIHEVRRGRHDGWILAWIQRFTSWIPTPQHRGAAQVLRNSEALSFTLTMKDGRIITLLNFLAWWPHEALQFVIPALMDKLAHDSADAHGEKP
jgi:hypothetical protein